MTKKLQDNTFSKLVEAIDKKWSHTYEDIEDKDLLFEIDDLFNIDDWDPKLIFVEELPLNDKTEEKEYKEELNSCQKTLS
jgi:hypothetical protein